MKDLPIEIFNKVFSYLSQRNLFIISQVCKQWYEIIFQPLFFSTIEIQSKKQLKKFIQLAKEKTIQDAPIGNYVSHIKFEISINLNKVEIQDLLSAFPNIQSIHNLNKEIIYNSITTTCYLHTPQTLTHFSYWVTDGNIEWMTDLLDDERRRIKLLELEMGEATLQLDGSPSVHIHMGPIGQPIQLPLYLNHLATKTTIIIRILTLPKLIYLTHLKIDFTYILDLQRVENSIFDERTFENIHKSCPQLESLVLEAFSFNISDNFDANIMNNNNSDNNSIFKPADRLKELDINGEFFDPRCYTYLSKKHPQIESLILILSAIAIQKVHSGPYKQAINNMLTHFHLLKKVKIYLYGSDNLLQNINKMEEEYFPNGEILHWLLQHPKQITHLTYCNKITKKHDYNTERSTINNINQATVAVAHDDAYENIINKIVLHHGFLKHLTSLSVTTNFLTDILYNYLLQNNQTIELSSSIKELVISNTNQYECINFVFIHNYLDVFPNLNSLLIKFVTVINDGDDLNNYYDQDFRSYNQNINKLNTLINQRHQQRQQHNLELSNGDRVYNLKHLSFLDCTIYMKNGLNNTLFKKLPHLKHLKFSRTRYSNATLNLDATDDFFDLSHLSLETLHIINFHYIPWTTIVSSKNNRGIVTKVTVNETAFDKKSTITDITSSSPSNHLRYQQCSFINLYLTCKYIDKIAFITPVTG